MLKRPRVAAPAAFALLLMLAAGPARPAGANFINFETRPNGATPTDNVGLFNSYTITGGTVGFYFLDSGGNRVNPVFEARGEADGDPQGFYSYRNSASDTPSAPGLGNWFLRQPDGNGVLPGPFIIDYNTTITIDALSGEIWDIDGTADIGFEQWIVEVLDRSGRVVATQISPRGLDPSLTNASLDSLPWTFAFSNLTALSTEVTRVRISFSTEPGAKTGGVGLAFNNFSAFQAVPEPGSVILTAIGGIGLLALSRRARGSRRAG